MELFTLLQGLDKGLPNPLVPSEVELNLEEYSRFRVLALEQFPYIPDDILDVFHPEYAN